MKRYPLLDIIIWVEFTLPPALAEFLKLSKKKGIKIAQITEAPFAGRIGDIHFQPIYRQGALYGQRPFGRGKNVDQAQSVQKIQHSR